MLGLWVLVFYATFNNISAISWWSVLLEEGTGLPGENHRPSAKQWQSLSHNALHLAPWAGFELPTSVVIDPDCIVSCKTNYSTMTATSPPQNITQKHKIWLSYVQLRVTCIYNLCIIQILTVVGLFTLYNHLAQNQT